MDREWVREREGCLSRLSKVLDKQLLARYSFDPGHGSKCPIYLSRVVYAFFGVAFSYVPTFIGVYIIQTSST